MFLKTIGLIAIIIFISIVAIIIFIRFKWKKFVNSMNKRMETPSEIHLMEDINPDWIGESAKSDMKAQGFYMGKAYTITEMPGLQLISIFHSSHKIIAGAYYFHEQVGDWYDLIADAAGEEITVTNAPSGEELNQRPGTNKIWKRDASFQELFQKILSITTDVQTFKQITPETFRNEFEKAYALDMAWRNSQGGVTEDEINRIADNMDKNFSKEAIQLSFKKIKKQELHRWHDEIMQKFSNSSEFKEKHEQKYFFISDQIEISVFLEYLSDYISLTQKQIDDFSKLITNTMKVTELFNCIIECMSPEVRPKLIQSIESPVKGHIFIAMI